MPSNEQFVDPQKHSHPSDSAEVAKQRTAPDPRIAANLARLMNLHELSQPMLVARTKAKGNKVGQSTISRILNGEAAPTATTLAALGDALGVGVDEFFRGELTDSGTLSIHDDAHNGHFELAGGLPAARKVPVVGTAKLGDNGFYEEGPTIAGEPKEHVEVSSADKKAYALRVRGDAMHPAIRDGWVIVAEPGAPLSAGEYVLIALRDGRRLLQELLYERRDSLAVVSLRGDVRVTIPREDVQAAHAVTAVLPPSRLRQGK